MKVDITEYGGPKAPPSGFMLFTKSVRAKVMEETKKDGKVDIGAVGKAIGEQWNKLQNAGQKPFTIEAAKLKEKYEKELSEFKETDKYNEYMEAKKKVKEEDEKKAKKLARREEKAQSGEPKRPPSGYFLFANDVRPAMIEAARKAGKKVDVGAIGKDIGEQWGKFTKEGKKKYEDEAAKLKEKYEKELAVWKADQAALAEKKAAEEAAKQPPATEEEPPAKKAKKDDKKGAKGAEKKDDKKAVKKAKAAAAAPGTAKGDSI